MVEVELHQLEFGTYLYVIINEINSIRSGENNIVIFYLSDDPNENNDVTTRQIINEIVLDLNDQEVVVRRLGKKSQGKPRPLKGTLWNPTRIHPSLPISWAMLAPAITPRRSNDGPNNPGLRLYKFDKDTGQVFDYMQYYLDLSKANANSNRNAEWELEYTFSSHYHTISDINAISLHALAEKLSLYNPQDSNSAFSKYYQANSVRINSNPLPGCDANCAHTHYCAITRVDFEEFHQCLKTAASALASSSRSLIRAPLVYLILFMSVVISLV